MAAALQATVAVLRSEMETGEQRSRELQAALDVAANRVAAAEATAAAATVRAEAAKAREDASAAATSAHDAPAQAARHAEIATTLLAPRAPAAHDPRVAALMDAVVALERRLEQRETELDRAEASLLSAGTVAEHAVRRQFEAALRVKDDALQAARAELAALLAALAGRSTVDAHLDRVSVVA